MKTVSQLLQGKGSSVWSVTPDSSVYDALKLMAEKNDQIIIHLYLSIIEEYFLTGFIGLEKLGLFNSNLSFFYFIVFNRLLHRSNYQILPTL